MSRERRLALGALVAWMVTAAIQLAIDPPLKHDEAQYAAAARGDAQWLYLSSGTVAIARLGGWLGDSAWCYRLVPALLGCGAIVAIWWLGRALAGERVGAYAAAVLAGAPPFVLRDGELIADLPAAACIVAGLALAIVELERARGPSWRLVGVAPAFAAGFYFRYGHAPLIAVIAVAGAVLWWRRLVARPLVVVATLAAFFALLVPHAVMSVRETGAVLGVLDFSASVPARSYVGEGLVGYLATNPLRFYGVVVAPVMMIGLASVLRPPARWRPTVFLAVIAVSQLVVIGLQTRAQPRYVYVAIMLLVVLGVDAARRHAEVHDGRWLARARRLVLPALALAWLAVAIAVVPINLNRIRSRAPIAAAGDAIAADTAGRSCVVAATQIPQLIWRTRCKAVIGFGPWDDWPRDRRIYVVSVPDGVVDVDAVARDARATPVPVATSDARARVWFLRRSE